MRLRAFACFALLGVKMGWVILGTLTWECVNGHFGYVNRLAQQNMPAPGHQRAA